MTSQLKGRFLVTGGGGFLGLALVRRLKSAGAEVLSLARGDYPELKALGVKCVRADLGAAKPDWFDAFEGIDAVFHVAAKVEMWGPLADFQRVNVQGTRNVIQACLAHRVPRLIFTSSPSVIADGQNLCGVNENYPYPKHYAAYYPQTKAEAEREVLAANGEKLATIVLRPHLIFGPGDTNLVPTILERARAGRLVQVGAGENLTDLTYIEDCVEAHLLAYQALENNPAARGQAYFISQGEPVNMWAWINQVLRLNGLPPIKRRVSVGLARAIASVAETVWRVLKLPGEPVLTRFLVEEMATSHYFDIGRAKRELGYQPRFTIAEALERTFGDKDHGSWKPPNAVSQ